MADKECLCKWSKEKIAKNKAKLAKITSDPKFTCKKCGVQAKKKGWLCKPKAT